MYRNDNWGWRARVGMFIVASEPIPEAEWWAMLPEGTSVHASRVTAPTPWAAWNGSRTEVTLSPDVLRGAEQFASMRLNAVVIGHSSSSFLGGKGWDEAVVEGLTGILGPDVAATTNGLDILAALKKSGITRPFLVLPAWFNDNTMDAGLAYYSDLGVDIAAYMRFDPGLNWREVPHAEMYPRGLGFAQEIHPLYAQIKMACPSAADGVLIAGTGFRCVGILDALEQDLGRPVISANQASLWNCLRLSGVRTDIDGYGALLRG